jgi:hypothetical protein
LLDITPATSNLVRWKPFANLLALVGPASELQSAKPYLETIAHSMKAQHGEILGLSDTNHNAKEKITRIALDGWAQLHPYE